MTGLMIKDFIALKKYLKQYLWMSILFLVLAVVLKSPDYIGFMYMLVGSMSILTSMSYDEQVGWNQYVVSMPLKKSEIVLAKYITWISITCVTGLVAIVAGYGLCIATGKDIKEFIVSMTAVSSVYIIMFSIMIPILYKLGVEKGRIVMIGVFLIPLIVTMLSGNLVKVVSSTLINSLIENAITILPLIAMFTVVGSFFVSVAVMKRKEW